MEYLDHINSYANNQSAGDYASQALSSNYVNSFNTGINAISSRLTAQTEDDQTQLGVDSGTINTGLTTKLSQMNSAYIQAMSDRESEEGTLEGAAVGIEVLKKSGTALKKAALKSQKVARDKADGTTNKDGDAFRDKVGTEENDGVELGDGEMERGVERADTGETAGAEETTTDLGEGGEELGAEVERPMAIGEEDSAEEIARQYQSSGRGAETELSGRGADAETGQVESSVERPMAIGEEDSASEIARQYERSGPGTETELGERGATAEARGTGSYGEEATSRLGSREVGELGDESSTMRQDITMRGETPARPTESFDTGLEEGGGDFTDMPGFGSSGATEAGAEAGEFTAEMASGVGDAATASTLDAVAEGVAASGGFVDPVTDIIAGGLLLTGLIMGGEDLFGGSKKSAHKEKVKEQKQQDKADDAQSQAESDYSAKVQASRDDAQQTRQAGKQSYQAITSKLAQSNHNGVTIGVSGGGRNY